MTKTIGIVGGGQLGRMLAVAATPLDLTVTVVDESLDCPAARAGANVVRGSVRDAGAIRAAALQSDVTTWEVEHVDASTLVELEAEGVPISPSPQALLRFQDKLRQKQELDAAGLPVAPFTTLDDPHDLDELASRLGAATTVICKRRVGSFDGRGNWPITVGELVEAVRTGEIGADEWYVEELVDFDREVALVLARDTFGTIAAYPLTETRHVDGICVSTETPAAVDASLEQKAVAIAEGVLDRFPGAGVFCVEFFVRGDTLIVNEVAPRVHNSGHATIEACETSQFEQHIRCVAGYPLGSTALRTPAAAMVNILGIDGELDASVIPDLLRTTNLHLHLYGKASRPGRKIGHVTVTGADTGECLRLATAAVERLTRQVIRP